MVSYHLPSCVGTSGYPHSADGCQTSRAGEASYCLSHQWSPGHQVPLVPAPPALPHYYCSCLHTHHILQHFVPNSDDSILWSRSCLERKTKPGSLSPVVLDCFLCFCSHWNNDLPNSANDQGQFGGYWQNEDMSPCTPAQWGFRGS